MARKYDEDPNFPESPYSYKKNYSYGPKGRDRDNEGKTIFNSGENRDTRSNNEKLQEARKKDPNYWPSGYRPHHGGKQSTTRLGDTSAAKALVQVLSFHCSNMSYGNPNGDVGPHRLTSTFPGGRVTVERVNGQEFVYIEEIAGDLFIVELVSYAKSYYGTYHIAKNKITRVRKLKQFDDKWTHYWIYFKDPLLDKDTESCNYIHPLIANVSDDNMFLPINSHKDDWHYNAVFWTGYPYWWATSGVPPEEYVDTWLHPGLHPGHKPSFSCSPFTYYQGKAHMNRCVCQERRLYRPAKLNLLKEGSLTGLTGDNRYLITTLDHDIFGKRPYSRAVDPNTNTLKLTSIKERVVLAGVVTPISDYKEWLVVNGVYGSYTVHTWDFTQIDKTRYFWPFIAYMWEISSYPIFEYGWNVIYRAYSSPEIGAFKSWELKYFPVIDGNVDTEVDKLLHTDIAEFHASEEVLTTTPWTPEIPRYIVGFNANGSWRTTFDIRRTWDFTTKKFYPICSLGKLLDLYIETDCSGTGEKWVTSENQNTKVTNFPAPYNGDNASMQPGWWPIGGYTETNVHFIERIDQCKTDITFVQSLKFGDTIIDSGAGTMNYLCDRTYRTDYNGTVTCGIAKHLAGLPWYANSQTWSYNEVIQGQLNMLGTGSRNIVCFEVLDYDSMTDFIYKTGPSHAVAVVYKRITITHGITRSADNSYNDITNKTGHSDFTNMPTSRIISFGWPWNYNNGIEGISGSVDERYSSTATRKVEFIVYINVDGHTYSKVIETFESSCTANTTTVSHSASGTRPYGVHLKICPAKHPGVFVDPQHTPYQKIPAGILVMSYDKETFLSDEGVAGGYDAAYNFEDWNNYSEEGVPAKTLWEYSNRVVGVFRIDGIGKFGMNLMDEQDPIYPESYGVNARKRKTF